MGVQEKKVNWPLIITGAVASSFVGTLYGYSYLKGEITEYWKDKAMSEFTNPEELNTAIAARAAAVNDAYYAGFTGQYLAIIPGLVFDKFGATITCWYGGALIATGFSLVGLGVKTVTTQLVILGLFLAGQGSKGLGFGTLLGTIRNIPESMSTGVSGLYLMLDALSAVACLMAYDGLKTGKDAPMSEKADRMKAFFIGMGVLIGCIAAAAGVIYYVAVPKADDEESAEESGRRSVVSRRSSIYDEAKAATLMPKESEQGSADEEAPLIAEAQPKQAKTFWGGVVCCFLVMLLSESQGLAFNNAIGEAFMASRRSKVGMVLLGSEESKTFDLPSLHGDLLEKTADDTHNELVRKLKDVTANVPKTLKVEGKVMTFSGAAEKASWKFTSTETMSGVLVTKGDGEKLTVDDCTGDTGCDLFAAIYGHGDKLGKIENAQLKKAVSALAPATGFVVHKDKDTKAHVYVVSHVTGDTFDNLGKPGEDFNVFTRDLEKTHGVAIAGKYPSALLQIFKEDSINHIKLTKKGVVAKLEDSVRGLDEKALLRKFHYPTFAHESKKLQELPYIKWATALQKTGDVVKPIFPKDAVVSAGVVFENKPDTKIFYNEILLQKGGDQSHEHAMKASKKTLTIVFTVGNAVGRLGLGLLMEAVAKRVEWLPCASWFVIGSVVYSILFLVFASSGIPSTTADLATEAPLGVFLLTGLTAIAYGGVFTINTAYMKKIVAPQRLGMVLGGSLFVLAVGSYIFGATLQGLAEKSNEGTYDIPHTVEQVGTDVRTVFFWTAMGMQMLALMPGAYCWYSQVLAIKAAKEEEDSE